LTGPEGPQGVAGADSTVVGPQGPKGDTGLQGIQGVAGADSTIAGPQGIQGPKGDTGLTGPSGPAGADSTVAGPQGIQGIQGLTGPKGDTGADGVSNIPGPQGIQGIQGPTGPEGPIGPAGPAGSGGGSSVFFNNISRYVMDPTPGQAVWCVSSSTVFTTLAWVRVGTLLTITNPSHGRSVGDRVIIRNASSDNFNDLITTVTTDTFTLPCADIGGLSGSAAAYSCGFKYAHNTNLFNITEGTLTAPANADVQLLSIRIRLKANTRAALTYSVNLPSSVTNGAGLDTNMDTMYLPFQQVRQDSDSLTAVGNTYTTNVSGRYSSFRFSALPAITTGLIFMIQF